MSPGREVLAQQAAARLFANICGGKSDLWNRQERQHNAAKTKSGARSAAAPLLEVCASCPIVQDCTQWAILDRYTGIAAGSAWVDGVARPTHWVPKHPPKRAHIRQPERRAG